MIPLSRKRRFPGSATTCGDRSAPRRLTLDGQGLGDLTLLAAKILPAQSRTDGDTFWLKATRDVHTATAAAYGVITV